ncbi:hypothetical protein Corgl_0306 [Coriobacterium glomerans PW2]|uniref:Uncharacterized protein n=1 Tax=Coriobacterium glomerans (strain ATCC 49209 / DSM 20642 / JCM 10262 / PW2) TaxID=700015 RepID=F2NA33_CORGP|nr:hypothetical protein Corgl_0306 [Coriobacterium glomerans PW2]
MTVWPRRSVLGDYSAWIILNINIRSGPASAGVPPGCDSKRDGIGTAASASNNNFMPTDLEAALTWSRT